jgi:hypothetical protein
MIRDFQGDPAARSSVIDAYEATLDGDLKRLSQLL